MKKKKIKGPPGAPPKLTLELIGLISDYLKTGAYVETAFMSCGVPKACFYEWMKKGRAARKGIYTALTDAVDKAVAEGEMRDLFNIERAAAGSRAEYLRDKNGEVVLDGEGNPIVTKPMMKPDWKASAWRLERRNPNRWSQKQTLEHTTTNEKTPSGRLTGEELDAEVLRLEAAVKACEDL